MSYRLLVFSCWQESMGHVNMLATFISPAPRFRYFAAMCKPFRLLLLLLLLTLLKTGISQDVKGHWFGIGNVQTSQMHQQYLSELVLRQKGKNVWGSLQYFFKDSLVNVPLTGSFDAQTRKLSINRFSVIYYQSPSAKNSIDCQLTGDLTLMVSKTESVLNGKLRPDADHRYTVPEISLRLTRSDDTLPLVKAEEPDIPKDTTPVTTTATTNTVLPSVSGIVPGAIAAGAAIAGISTAEVFAKREKVYTKEFEVTGPSLKLELYDNGQVDYDSVSLFFNNKMILAKTKLEHRAIRLTVTLDPELEDNELSMFAENLGMVPPNTAALIITDGANRYEVQLSSDLNKSATIRLRKKK
jgi:hypothetical protein